MGIDTVTFGRFSDTTSMPKATLDENAVCRQAAMVTIVIGTIGLDVSLSDAGVGVQMGRAAGAYQNVCINMSGLDDAARKMALLERADAAWERVKELHASGEDEFLVKLRKAAT